MRVLQVADGEAGVAEIADIALGRGASVTDAADIRTRQTASEGGFLPLTVVPADAWSALAARAIEPNGYYLPAWELAVNASVAGRTGTSALCAWSDASPAARLVGLMPAISMRRAYGIPLPALVSGHPYGTLCTPLIDRERPEAAAASLIQAARDAGARALILRDVSLAGAAMAAITDVLRARWPAPARAAIARPRLPRRDARSRRVAA